MGFLESGVTLGTLMGTFLSSYVFDVVGYVGVFASCSAIVAFVAVYTYFLVPESVVVKRSEVNAANIKNLLLVKNCFVSARQKPSHWYFYNHPP